jgi:o-succinylbenzoate synthase
MRLYSYDIPLITPVFSMKSRQGLIIETSNGLGEVAPLPGWSQENLQDILTKPHPSLEFGLLSASSAFPTIFPSIEIAALTFNRKDVIKAIQQGYQTIKLKVKNTEIANAIDIINQSPASIRWRIDANRSWDLQETIKFFRSIDEQRIEYIEEPLQNIQQLDQLPFIPIALDETLLSFDATQTLIPDNIRAFVLKPTLLGSRIHSLIDLGHKLHKTLVFSSCFESEIGLFHIARLQSIHSPKIAAGIDTYRYFQNHFLTFPVQNGKLMPKTVSLDRRWLSEIAL